MPVTVIGERVWIGFDDAKAEAIEKTVEAALAGDAKALEPEASTSWRCRSSARSTSAAPRCSSAPS